MVKDKSKSFPMLPVAHWWTLRDKFKQSIPGVVTENYLATILKTQPESARANVLGFLRDLGLIDAEGKPQSLAKAWRDDNQYAEVCAAIRKKVYPDDLISAVPKPADDRETVERWFANHTGSGSTAVRRMAAIYILISEADVTKKPDSVAKSRSQKMKKAAAKPADTRPVPAATTAASVAPGVPATPGLNINLEIHISSDASPDQIDKIFESMARHIYKK